VKITLHGESLNFLARRYPSYLHAQDWYRCEDFAAVGHEGTYDVSTADAPAAAFVKAYVTRYLADNTVLWANDWLLTNDKDHNGDPVYVGKPAQYGGFQIHRRLSKEPV
jgi:hypothetical protein